LASIKRSQLFQRKRLSGPSLISVKLEDHDIRVPIAGMGSEVAFSRRIRVLVITARYRHNLSGTRLPLVAKASEDDRAQALQMRENWWKGKKD